MGLIRLKFSTFVALWFVVPFTISQAAFGDSKRDVQKSSDNVVTKRVVKEETKPIEVNQYIRFGLDGGFIFSNPNIENEITREGKTLNLGVSYGIYTDIATFDLGLQWWQTQIKTDDEVVKNIQEGETIVTKINTQLGVGRAAVLFGSRRIAIGPVVNMLFGADSGFGPVVEKKDIPNVMAGITLRITLIEPTPEETFTSSIDVNYLTDLTIDERRVDTFTVGIGFGFGLVDREKKVVEQITRTKTKTRFRTKKLVVPTVVEEKQFYIDAGFVNFETARHELPSNDNRYLITVAKVLSKYRKHWKEIIIRSHTDYRGGELYNEALSKRRAHMVEEVFQRARIPSSAITIESKAFSQPVSSKKSFTALAKNRRVEILVRGDNQMDELKSMIITLQQRFQQPGTCSGTLCK